MLIECLSCDQGSTVRVDQVSMNGVNQHMTTAAFSTHYPQKSNPKLITDTYVARYTGN